MLGWYKTTLITGSGFLALKYILQINSQPHTLNAISPLPHLLPKLLQQPPNQPPCLYSSSHLHIAASYLPRSRILGHSPHAEPFHVSSMPARLEPSPSGWFRALPNLALWTSLQPHFCFSPILLNATWPRRSRLFTTPTPVQHARSQTFTHAPPGMLFFFLPIAQPWSSLESHLEISNPLWS